MQPLMQSGQSMKLIIAVPDDCQLKLSNGQKICTSAMLRIVRNSETYRLALDIHAMKWRRDGTEAVPYNTNRGANGLLPNGNISSLATPSALRATVSLRLGHGAALTCHRHVIHYRAAASLP